MSKIASIKIGDVFQTNNCGLCTVIDYNGIRNVKVRFKDTGYVCKTFARSLKLGAVKDPYVRSVYGVGYIGEGESTTLNGKKTRFYRLWGHMLERCYSQRISEICPTYQECEVAPRWHNFQNFVKDIKSLEGYDSWLDPESTFELDKDTKIPGNKIYSIATCRFISKAENIKDAMKRRHNK